MIVHTAGHGGIVQFVRHGPVLEHVGESLPITVRSENCVHARYGVEVLIHEVPDHCLATKMLFHIIYKTHRCSIIVSVLGPFGEVLVRMTPEVVHVTRNGAYVAVAFHYGEVGASLVDPGVLIGIAVEMDAVLELVCGYMLSPGIEVRMIDIEHLPVIGVRIPGIVGIIDLVYGCEVSSRLSAPVYVIQENSHLVHAVHVRFGTEDCRIYGIDGLVELLLKPVYLRLVVIDPILHVDETIIAGASAGGVVTFPCVVPVIIGPDPLLVADSVPSRAGRTGFDDGRGAHEAHIRQIRRCVHPRGTVGIVVFRQGTKIDLFLKRFTGKPVDRRFIRKTVDRRFIRKTVGRRITGWLAQSLRRSSGHFCFRIIFAWMNVISRNGVR